jgi:hypothetical protein
MQKEREGSKASNDNSHNTNFHKQHTARISKNRELKDRKIDIYIYIDKIME